MDTFKKQAYIEKQMSYLQDAIDRMRERGSERNPNYGDAMRRLIRKRESFVRYRTFLAAQNMRKGYYKQTGFYPNEEYIPNSSRYMPKAMKAELEYFATPRAMSELAELRETPDIPGVCRACGVDLRMGGPE